MYNLFKNWKTYTQFKNDDSAMNVEKEKTWAWQEQLMCALTSAPEEAPEEVSRKLRLEG